MSIVFYGVVNNVDDKDVYNITIFTEEGEDIRSVRKVNFLEKIEKRDIIKITTWRRKNVVSFRYEKATQGEILELYGSLVPEVDLLPNFELYKDYLLSKPKE